MKADDIELIVAKHINCRRNLCVPNVSWGLGLAHECDVLYVTGSGYAHEIEIKVSRGDLMRDRKKRKFRCEHNFYMRGTKIRSLTYAIPKELRGSIPDLPVTAGVWVVEPDRFGRIAVTEHRKAKTNTTACKLTQEEVQHLGHLAAMRMWDLKGKLRNEQERT